MLWITLASVIDSLAQQNMNYYDSVSETQNEENEISTPTVFGVWAENYLLGNLV